MSCWLAPESDDETIEVPIDTGLINHEKEDGSLAKRQSIKQATRPSGLLCLAYNRSLLNATRGLTNRAEGLILRRAFFFLKKG